MRFLPILAGAFLLVAGVACSLLGAATPTPFVLSTLAPTQALVEPTTAPTAAPTAAAPPTTAPVINTQPPATPAPTTAAPRPGTPTPVPPPTRISFQRGGTSATVQRSLGQNGIDRFVLRVLGGQTMSVNVVSSQANMLLSVNGVDGNVLKSMGAGSPNWSGTVPTTQDYILTISTANGAPASYTLTVTIPPLATAPVAQDLPRRITFASGAAVVTVPGTSATPGSDRFVLRALAGQTITVNIASAPGNVIVIIYGADGNVLISDHAGATNWTGQLPSTQDYMIDTRSVGNAVVPFTLTVTVK